MVRSHCTPWVVVCFIFCKIFRDFHGIQIVVYYCFLTKDTAQDFLFADDCAINDANQFDMQRSMDLFATACNNFGLTVSTKKTEVMYQPAPGTPYTDPVITANGQKLASAEKFVYLGSTLSKSALLDEEIALRIARASTAFGRLQDSV